MASKAGKAGAVAAGIGVTSSLLNSSAILKYRKDHPKTKMTDAQILKTLYK